MNVAQRNDPEHKSQYFGSDVHQLSQDLRTPLNSISGFAELLLLDEGLSPASAVFVRAILSESQALIETVAALLDRAGEHGAIVMPSREVSSRNRRTSVRPMPKRGRGREATI